MAQKKAQRKESSEESPSQHDEVGSDMDEQVDTNNQEEEEQQQDDDDDNHSVPMETDEVDKEEEQQEEDQLVKPKQQLHNKAGIVVSVADVKRCFQTSSCPDEAAVYIAASIEAIVNDVLSKLEKKAIRDGYSIDSEVIRLYTAGYFEEQSLQVSKRYNRDKVLRSSRPPINKKILAKKTKSKDGNNTGAGAASTDTDSDKKKPSARKMFNASSQRLIKLRTGIKKSSKRPTYHSKVNIHDAVSVCMVKVCETYRDACNRLIDHSGRKHLKTPLCKLATSSLLPNSDIQTMVMKKAEKAVRKFNINSAKIETE